MQRLPFLTEIFLTIKIARNIITNITFFSFKDYAQKLLRRRPPISLRAYPSLRRYISLNERSLLFFPWAFYFSPSYVIQFRFSVLFRIIYLFRPLKFGGKSCEARLHHECRSASVMHMTGFMSNW